MWECFCDRAYFDQWAVRDIGDKAFTSAIHVPTQKEAEFLVQELNDKRKQGYVIQDLEERILNLNQRLSINEGDS